MPRRHRRPAADPPTGARAGQKDVEVRSSQHAVVSAGMIVGAIVAVQLGAALAATMFDEVGAMGMVFLRLGLAAIVLCAISRPAVRGRSRNDWALTGVFGTLTAVLSLASYAAVDRLPLGLVVTLELLGPLCLAVAMSRRARELAWTGVALVGVVLLSEMGDSIDVIGVVYALIGAVSWAGYILASARTGERSDGFEGLALAITVAAVLTAPAGIAGAGGALLRPSVLLAGFGVAMMTSVVNFGLEFAALRRMSPRTFGVLMSLSPAMAALAGLLVLDQHLAPLQIAGVALVIAASAATVSTSTPEPARSAGGSSAAEAAATG